MNYGTWNISNNLLLFDYVVASMIAVAVAFCLVLATGRSEDTGLSEDTGTSTPRDLTPPEVGMLTSDGRAVAAAICTLKASKLIGFAAKPGPPPEDPFTAAVFDHVRKRGYRLLTSRLRSPIAEMRVELAERGLLVSGRPETVARKLLLVAAAVGMILFVLGLISARPIAPLLGILICVFGLGMAMRTLRRVATARRATSLGELELRKLRNSHRYLSPRLRPSYATHGASMAGMSGALFGSSALFLMDRRLAKTIDWVFDHDSDGNMSDGGGFWSDWGGGGWGGSGWDGGAGGGSFGGGGDCGGGGGGCG